MVGIREFVGFVVEQMYSILEEKNYVRLEDLHNFVVGAVVQKYGCSSGVANALYNPVYWVVVLDKNGSFDLVPKVSMNFPPPEQRVVRRIQKEKPVEISDAVLVDNILSKYGVTLEVRFNEFSRERP